MLDPVLVNDNNIERRALGVVHQNCAVVKIVQQRLRRSCVREVRRTRNHSSGNSTGLILRGSIVEVEAGGVCVITNLHSVGLVDTTNVHSMSTTYGNDNVRGDLIICEIQAARIRLPQCDIREPKPGSAVVRRGCLPVARINNIISRKTRVRSHRRGVVKV